MTRPAELGQVTWPQLDGRDATVLVPLGAVEQHGPHLPLDTDIRVADEVTRGALDRLGTPEADAGYLLAPALAYGASGEHEGFPGTVSIGHEALHLLLVEYGRSVCRWARRVVFVNGHGGNVATVVSAVALLRQEGRDATWFACAPRGADAHAGYTETSVLLHVAPDLVRRSQVASGVTESITTLLPRLRSHGVAAVAENGVLGDPREADADAGARIIDALTEALASSVRRWDVDDSGRLT